MDVMTKLALHFQEKASEKAKDLSKQADRQNKILDKQKRLRAIEDKVTTATNDNKLTRTEANEIKSLMEAEGLDASDLNYFFNIYDRQNHPDYAWIKADASWSQGRQDAIKNLESKLKNAKDNESDSDDQVSFQIQMGFSHYSRAVQQASSTEKKRDDFDKSVIQNW